MLALGVERPLLKSRHPYGGRSRRQSLGHIRARGGQHSNARSSGVCSRAASSGFARQLSIIKRRCSRAAPRAIGRSSDICRATQEGENTAHYSSIELSCSDIAIQPRPWAPGAVPRLVTVGSLAQRYKGIDVLIREARTGRPRPPLRARRDW